MDSVELIQAGFYDCLIGKQYITGKVGKNRNKTNKEEDHLTENDDLKRLWSRNMDFQSK